MRQDKKKYAYYYGSNYGPIFGKETIHKINFCQ